MTNPFLKLIVGLFLCSNYLFAINVDAYSPTKKLAFRCSLYLQHRSPNRITQLILKDLSSVLPSNMILQPTSMEDRHSFKEIIDFIYYLKIENQLLEKFSEESAENLLIKAFVHDICDNPKVAKKLYLMALDQAVDKAFIFWRLAVIEQKSDQQKSHEYLIKCLESAKVSFSELMTMMLNDSLTDIDVIAKLITGYTKDKAISLTGEEKNRQVNNILFSVMDNKFEMMILRHHYMGPVGRRPQFQEVNKYLSDFRKQMLLDFVTSDFGCNVAFKCLQSTALASPEELLELAKKIIVEGKRSNTNYFPLEQFILSHMKMSLILDFYNVNKLESELYDFYKELQKQPENNWASVLRLYSDRCISFQLSALEVMITIRQQKNSKFDLTPLFLDFLKRTEVSKIARTVGLYDCSFITAWQSILEKENNREQFNIFSKLIMNVICHDFKLSGDNDEILQLFHSIVYQSLRSGSLLELLAFMNDNMTIKYQLLWEYSGATKVFDLISNRIYGKNYCTKLFERRVTESFRIEDIKPSTLAISPKDLSFTSEYFQYLYRLKADKEKPSELIDLSKAYTSSERLTKFFSKHQKALKQANKQSKLTLYQNLLLTNFRNINRSTEWSKNMMKTLGDYYEKSASLNFIRKIEHNYYEENLVEINTAFLAKLLATSRIDFAQKLFDEFTSNHPKYGSIILKKLNSTRGYKCLWFSRSYSCSKFILRNLVKFPIKNCGKLVGAELDKLLLAGEAAETCYIDKFYEFVAGTNILENCSVIELISSTADGRGRNAIMKELKSATLAKKIADKDKLALEIQLIFSEFHAKKNLPSTRFSKFYRDYLQNPKRSVEEKKRTWDSLDLMKIMTRKPTSNSSTFEQISSLIKLIKSRPNPAKMSYRPLERILFELLKLDTNDKQFKDVGLLLLEVCAENDNYTLPKQAYYERKNATYNSLLLKLEMLAKGDAKATLPQNVHYTDILALCRHKSPDEAIIGLEKRFTNILLYKSSLNTKISDFPEEVSLLTIKLKDQKLLLFHQMVTEFGQENFKNCSKYYSKFRALKSLTNSEKKTFYNLFAQAQYSEVDLKEVNTLFFDQELIVARLRNRSHLIFYYILAKFNNLSELSEEYIQQNVKSLDVSSLYSRDELSVVTKALLSALDALPEKGGALTKKIVVATALQKLRYNKVDYSSWNVEFIDRIFYQRRKKESIQFAKILSKMSRNGKLNELGGQILDSNKAKAESNPN